MRVISLGAGVQSTTVLLLAHRGELPGGPVDYAIFADTGWEPAGVYRHLAWLEEVSAVPIIRAAGGNLRTDALDPTRRFASIPLFIVNRRGDQGRVRRQCTHEYKIEVINRQLRQLLGVGPRARIPPGTVTSLLGLSLDEVQRMKPERERWVTIEWPLIDLRMTRHDCVLWLQRHGYPVPPKSSCIGCPFHSDAHWREMRDHRPTEWENACDFDERIRQLRRPTDTRPVGDRYLHRSMRPLRDVDLATPEDGGQTDMFAEECNGLCST